jgi:hypothetical protein
VCLALCRYVEHPTRRRALVVGLVGGAALLTRHNAIILVAAAAVVVAVTAGIVRGRERAVRAGVVLFASWVVVWLMIRGFDFTAPTGPAGARLDGLVAAARSDSLLARAVLAIPWPKEWGAGFAYLTLTSTPRAAYLLGAAWTGSQLWYFPVTLAVKTPLPVLALLIAGPFGLRGLPPATRRVLLAAIVVPGTAVLLGLLAQPLDLGLRYAFPVLALLCVLAGGVTTFFRTRWVPWVVGAVGTLAVAAVVASTPHSIAWTPPPFQPAYRFVSDSNVDYGQDALRAIEWATDKNALVDLQSARGIEGTSVGTSLLDVPQSDVRGWVVVSATRLTVEDRDELSWLRAYCPVGDIDGSILLYWFDGPVDFSPGPTMPESSCDGAVSMRSG